MTKRFNREALTWSGLRNMRILPLLGTCELEGYTHLVAPWAENGNLAHYVRLHPDIRFESRRRLVRMRRQAVIFFTNIVSHVAARRGGRLIVLASQEHCAW